MKKVLKGLLLVAVIISLAFTFAACGSDGNGNGNGGSAFIGETLTLSGQVWTVYRDYDESIRISEQFSGNGTLTNAGFWIYDGDYDYYYDIGGSGSITSGQLSFTVGTPSETANISEYFNWVEVYNNFNISPSDAQVAAISYLEVANGTLYKEWENNTTEERVRYIYVDRDVTISGGGKTIIYECDCEEWEGQCYCYDCDCGGTAIYRNINFSLKTGWNVLTMREERNERNQTTTLSISTGDSSRARWVLDGDTGNNGTGGNNTGSQGAFTLTNIPPEYNGKYACLFSTVNDTSYNLIGFVSYNDNEFSLDLTLPRISNGSVSIPMWINHNNGDLLKYSGNNSYEIQNILLEVFIFNNPTLSYYHQEIASWRLTTGTLVFQNGNTTKSWNDGVITE